MVELLHAGARVANRYRIESLLGRGGMGQVYRAVDEQLGRPVAIKILPPQLTSDPARFRRFVTEARTASALNHPNILTIHEFGSGSVDDSTERNVHYIVMELIEGTTLRNHLARPGRDLRSDLRLAAQVADGLAKAHAAGIAHRDLKPENVMITADGFAKIVDFGLAKLLDAPVTAEAVTLSFEGNETHPGAILGTVGYMSPEQVRGTAVDHRSDVFSLGAILWEIATGERAFGGETAVDKLHGILYAEPVAPREIPPELERVIRKCLAKDPDDRYQRARDVAEDLRALRLTPSRKPIVAAALAAVVVASVAVVALQRGAGFSPPMDGLKPVLRPAAIGSLAVLPFENRGGARDLEYLSDGLTESLINELGRISGARVISRSSVFRYKGSRKDPASIARELRVATLILGGIQQRGDRTSVSVELVDARDGSHLWGEQYDVQGADLARVEEDVARKVCDRLAWRLVPRAAGGGARDPDVYRLYLRGRHHWNRRSPADLRTSIDYYDEAILRQPDFAPAHAGRAEAYAMLVNSNAFPGPEGLAEVSRSARRALELDPSLAEAHLALAFLHHNEYRWAEMDEEVRLALKANPNSATAYQFLAISAAEQGRFDDAFASIARALSLDPFALPLNNASVVVRYLAGDYDTAVREAERTVALDPTFASVHRFLSRTYVEQRRFDLALREAQTYARLAPSPVANADLAIVYARSGDRRSAEEIARRLRSLAKAEYVTPVDMAALELALGREQEAFDWLDRAFAARADALTILAVDPRFARVREDPRFTSLLRRMNLRVS